MCVCHVCCGEWLTYGDHKLSDLYRSSFFQVGYYLILLGTKVILLILSDFLETSKKLMHCTVLLYSVYTAIKKCPTG